MSRKRARNRQRSPARPTGWLARRTRFDAEMPRQTASCCIVATVIAQAPSAICRSKSCGAIVVLPCGAISRSLARGESAHPGAVGLQDALADHRERHRHVAAENAPALPRRYRQAAASRRAAVPSSDRRGAGPRCSPSDRRGRAAAEVGHSHGFGSSGEKGRRTLV